MVAERESVFSAAAMTAVRLCGNLNHTLQIAAIVRRKEIDSI
jgi:hypothetical protein